MEAYGHNCEVRTVKADNEGKCAFEVSSEGLSTCVGSTPTAPLAKLALALGQEEVVNGLLAFGFAHPLIQQKLWETLVPHQSTAATVSLQLPPPSTAPPPAPPGFPAQQPGVLSFSRGLGIPRPLPGIEPSLLPPRPLPAPDPPSSLSRHPSCIPIPFLSSHPISIPHPFGANPAALPPSIIAARASPPEAASLELLPPTPRVARNLAAQDISSPADGEDDHPEGSQGPGPAARRETEGLQQALTGRGAAASGEAADDQAEQWFQGGKGGELEPPPTRAELAAELERFATIREGPPRRPPSSLGVMSGAGTGRAAYTPAAGQASYPGDQAPLSPSIPGMHPAAGPARRLVFGEDVTAEEGPELSSGGETGAEPLPSLRAGKARGGGGTVARAARGWTAFTAYGLEMRRVVRAEFPDARAAEVEKIVGQRWAKLAPEQKQRYAERAAGVRRQADRQAQQQQRERARTELEPADAGGRRRVLEMLPRQRPPKRPLFGSEKPPPAALPAGGLFRTHPRDVGAASLPPSHPHRAVKSDGVVGPRDARRRRGDWCPAGSTDSTGSARDDAAAQLTKRRTRSNSRPPPSPRPASTGPGDHPGDALGTHRLRSAISRPARFQDFVEGPVDELELHEGGVGAGGLPGPGGPAVKRRKRTNLAKPPSLVSIPSSGSLASPHPSGRRPAAAAATVSGEPAADATALTPGTCGAEDEEGNEELSAAAVLEQIRSLKWPEQ